MIYNIAELNIKLNPIYNEIAGLCKDYISPSVTADIEINITKEDIIKESDKAEANFSEQYLETLAVYRKLAEVIPQFNGFLLHASVVDVKGVGVVFAAHSGVGKTTHTLFWKDLIGKDLKIVNGDKPIIRITKNTPYAYGTPWCGKENLSTNMKTPIKHLCFIVRDRENFVKPLDKKDCINRLLNQIYMPKSPDMAVKTLSLIDAFLSQVNVWEIHCLPNLDSAKTAYKILFKGE